MRRTLATEACEPGAGRTGFPECLLAAKLHLIRLREREDGFRERDG
jgi:hypothetical protein